MSDCGLVIVGGGLASARAIKAYREAGGFGRIALVSKDSSVPYHRPPLSNRYLRGETDRDGTLVEPEAFYASRTSTSCSSGPPSGSARTSAASSSTEVPTRTETEERLKQLIRERASEPLDAVS